MKNILLVILLPFFSCTGNKHEGPKLTIPSADKIVQMAQDESLIPVHPGIPGKTPFWNAFSRRFIYAPAFDFKEIKDALEYRYIASAENSGETYSFIADKPWRDLSSIWTKIPIGTINLNVEAIQNGEVIGLAGERTFYKASPFNGPYHNVEQTYLESTSQVLKYLFNAPYVKHWFSDKSPDMDYGLYSYPSKMFPAVIDGMLMFLDMAKDEKQKNEALQIASNAADYLIEISQPKGSSLEYFPPTYSGSIYSDIDKVYIGESLADRMMLIYPATAAGAYLDLFDKTQNQKYFDAAIRIAQTYKKLQLKNGSWYLLSYLKDGLPVADNYVVPIEIKILMDRIKKDYSFSGFESCGERALKFIEDNMVREFKWEGQFEDQKPSENYKNLSKGQACTYALYLLNNSNNPEVIDQAVELVRFAEDQFVIWESPIPSNDWKIKSDAWLTPCVLEQYNFYIPVNSSSADMIEAFRAIYQETGKILYLAKAIELANNILKVQNFQSGLYPTYLVSNLLEQEGWINCMVHTAKVIIELDEYLTAINYDKSSDKKIDLVKNTDRQTSKRK